jgi:hypothetical protein
MSKCNIRIEFDRGDRAYRGGETVSGNVVVQADKDVECKAFTIELYWQTHGKGNRDSKVIHKKSEPEQRWEPDVEYNYPFGFRLPSRPLTYHGHYINIDYYLQARANLAWARDPKINEEIVVLPGADAVDEDSVQVEAGVSDESLGRKRKEIKDFIPKTVPGILTALIVILGIAYYVPILGFIFFVGLIVYNKHIRSAWAEKKLGSVVADFEGGRVHPGNIIPVGLRLDKIGNVKVNSVSAKIEGQEICESGSGTDVRTYKHKLHDEKISFESSSPNEFRGEIKVPDTGAYTFYAPDNRIIWTVTLYVDVPGWPDWQRSLPLIVVPKPPEQTGNLAQ